MNLRTTFNLGLVEAVAGASPVSHIGLNVKLINYNRGYGEGEKQPKTKCQIDADAWIRLKQSSYLGCIERTRTI